MSQLSNKEFTTVVRALRGGDPRAADRLVPHVYDELHELAAAHMRRERVDHTLQPTALVHEVYLRLVKDEDIRWEDRAHFIGWAARIMRQVLVNHAKRHRTLKRGGDRQRVPLDGLAVEFDKRALDILALDEALDELTSIDERKRRIVELRFFGGLSMADVAAVLELSHTTIERDWRFARAWLHGRVSAELDDAE